MDRPVALFILSLAMGFAIGIVQQTVAVEVAGVTHLSVPDDWERDADLQRHDATTDKDVQSNKFNQRSTVSINKKFGQQQPSNGGVGHLAAQEVADIMFGRDDLSLNNNGTCDHGLGLIWNVQVGASIFATPLITDLSSDGRKEIVVPTVTHHLEALDGSSGEDVQGWPLSHPSLRTHVRMIETDLNHDGLTEFLVSTYDGVLAFVDHQGEPLDPQTSIQIPRMPIRKDWANFKEAEVEEKKQQQQQESANAGNNTVKATPDKKVTAADALKAKEKQHLKQELSFFAPHQTMVKHDDHLMNLRADQTDVHNPIPNHHATKPPPGHEEAKKDPHHQVHPPFGKHEQGNLPDPEKIRQHHEERYEAPREPQQQQQQQQQPQFQQQPQQGGNGYQGYPNQQPQYQGWQGAAGGQQQQQYAPQQPQYQGWQGQQQQQQAPQQQQQYYQQQPQYNQQQQQQQQQYNNNQQYQQGQGYQQQQQYQPQGNGGQYYQPQFNQQQQQQQQPGGGQQQQQYQQQGGASHAHGIGGRRLQEYNPEEHDDVGEAAYPDYDTHLQHPTPAGGDHHDGHHDDGEEGNYWDDHGGDTADDYYKHYYKDYYDDEGYGDYRDMEDFEHEDEEGLAQKIGTEAELSPEARRSMDLLYHPELYENDMHMKPERNPFKPAGFHTTDFNGGGKTGRNMHGDELVYLDAHILAAPTVVDLDHDGNLDAVVPVSYYWDEADIAAGKVQVPEGVNPKMYVVGGLIAVDLVKKSVKWTKILHQTTKLVSRPAYMMSSPILVNVDEDAMLDFAITTSQGVIAVYDWRGIAKRGWPKHMAGFHSGPLVEDVDGDGHADICAADLRGNVACYSRIGMEIWERQLAGAISETPTAGDVNGDGFIDLVVATADGNIYALDGRTGHDVQGGGSWPVQTEGPILSPVLLVNLNNTQPPFAEENGKGLHIVVPSHDGYLYIVSGRSHCVEKVDVGETSYSMVLAEDVNNDGYLDLIMTTLSGSVLAYTTSTLHHPLKAWPKRFNSFNGQTAHEGHLGVYIDSAYRKPRDVRGDFFQFGFHIYDKRPGAYHRFHPTYFVTITIGKRLIVHTALYSKATNYVVRIGTPLERMYGTVWVMMMLPDGRFYEDSVSIGFNMHFLETIKWVMLIPFMACIGALILVKKEHQVQPGQEGAAGRRMRGRSPQTPGTANDLYYSTRRNPRPVIMTPVDDIDDDDSDEDSDDEELREALRRYLAAHRI